MNASKTLNALSFAILITLTGCSSEVDKCVEDYMEAFDSNFGKVDASERAKAKADFRKSCLKAASGNQ